MTAVPNRIRLLHVDDEPALAETVADFLERADERITVEQVTSVQDALERLSDDIDCIVSDHDMPGQDGLEELEAVRAEFPDLPFILFTGKGSEELATEDCDTPHLEKADNAVARSLRLIEDLLAVGRGTDPVQELTSVSLENVVEDCWETVETASATLRTETTQRIRSDPNRLQQLLENLVRNAVDHGGESVTITIGDLEDGIYVADDGPGIPAALRDRVAQPGYSTEGNGIGFGLYIVQDIAEAHGWDDRFTESEAGGACCEITGVDVEG